MTVVLPVSTDPRKKATKTQVILMTVFGFPFLCVVLLYFAYILIGPHWTPEGRTQMNMMVITEMFENYTLDNGAVPPSSENYRLVQTFMGKGFDKKSYFTPDSRLVNANQEFIDGWATPFRISFKSKDNIVIISAGPDKIFGTADDITNQ